MNQHSRKARLCVAAVLAALIAVLPAARVSGSAAPAPQSPIRPPELSVVSRAVFLPDDATPSPDGRLLAIYRTGGLFVKNLATGDVRVLFDEVLTGPGICEWPRPAWSSDSAQIAFAWCAAETQELRTIGADGTGARVVLPRTDHRFADLAWSPNGEDIAVSYHNPDALTFFIGVIPVSRGVLRELHAGEGERRPAGLAFSPDGRFVAYTPWVAPRNVFVLPLDGTGERALFPSASSNNTFQGWTPNGRGILFTSDRSGTTDLWRVHVQNGRPIDLPTRLVRDVAGLDSRGVMSNGTLYYSFHRESAVRQSDVYIVSTDPASGRILTAPAAVSQGAVPSGNPVWSRDGRQLAFRSFGVGPHNAISILSAETGEERRLPVTSPAPQFDWSPDNRFFLLGALGVRIDADTGAAATIEGVGGIGPRWAPDGRSVAYRATGESVEMWELEADGLSVRTPKTIVQTGGDFLITYAFSPDGGSVAWIAQDDARRATLKVTHVSSGAVRFVANIQSPSPYGLLSWAPDGHIVFSDNTASTTMAGTAYRQQELWRVPAAGGTPQKLGLTLDHIGNPRFSPDGRFLAFESHRSGPSGLFVIENLLPTSDLK
jgi:Tol biopolymer transport system component